MPIVYEEAIKTDISSGKTAPCYLLFGNDSFLKKHYADSLCKICFDGDPFFNLQRFENSFDMQELFNAVTQYPMMADKKCVCVSDFDFERASKTELDSFIEVISQTGEECTLVIRFDSVEFDAKKNSKAKRIITACEKRGGKAVCLDHRKPQALVKTVINAAVKRGCKISDTNARHLIESVGEDIYVLQNEIEKLCSFVRGGEIDKQTVDFVCIKTVEASVYDFTKKIFACDVSAALKFLDDMFFMRIEPGLILHTVASTYIDIYRVFTGGSAGKKVSEISNDFAYKNRSFVLERAAENVRKLDSKKFNLSFDALLWADDALKSFSSDAQTVLEQLTVKLIYIILKGETVDKT